jgi:hypothetical protein
MISWEVWSQSVSQLQVFQLEMKIKRLAKEEAGIGFL